MGLADICMVQSVSRHIEEIEPPTLIMTDECQHSPAESYRKIYRAFPDAYRVGLSATPTRLHGGGLGAVFDELVIGPSVRELIDRGCLADFDYYAPRLIDTDKLRRRSNGEFDTAQAAQVLSTAAIYGDVIRHYEKLAAGKQAICYCATVAHSQQTAGAFTAAGIPAAHIDGTTGAAERAAAIERFRCGEIRVLCNVDLISEGFDVPDCGCSILLRPTHSLVLHTQQSMRCMRFKAGKRAVIIDHVGNVFRHGLPDEPHEWTLEGRKRQSKKNMLAVRQCPECFFAHRSSPVCPGCGYVYPKTEREILEEKKEAELVKIQSRLKTAEDCRTMKELMAFAKKNGYKPGWAYWQAKRRGWKV